MSNSIKLLSKKQVKELVVLSYAHTARLEAEGKFPRRLRLGTYRSSRAAYVESEIQDWIKTQLDKR